MNEPVKEQKLQMRRELRERLRAMDPQHRQESSEKLCRRLIAHPWWVEAQTVGTFSPLVIEPNLNPLWELGALAEKRACYSRVEEGTLQYYYVNGLDDLEEEQLMMTGIRRPMILAVPRERADRRVAPQEIDLLLVPGLAFSPSGQRIGKGGGYFDRFIGTSGFQGRTLGIAFSCQVLEVIPMESHDVTLQKVLTENGEP